VSKHILATTLLLVPLLSASVLLSAATQSHQAEQQAQSQRGRILFKRSFKVAEGFGYRLGNPELVLFNRHLGPDAKSCLECHSIGGEAGGGENNKNVFVGLDPALERRLARGNERNSTALWGIGPVQALAQEMSRELKSIRQSALEQAKRTNQYTTRNGKPVSHDDNANQTINAVWDARDRLVSLSGPNFTASFTYDAMGRRTSKTVNGQTKTYLYDGSDLISETGADYTFGPGIDEPLERKTNQNEYYLSDALGSVIGLTDINGAIKTSYNYSPFGKKQTTGAASGNPFAFTGREDDGTGYYYYRARYYSPDQKRFIAEDPAEFSGGDSNLYSYVGNSPLNAVDPTGRFIFAIPAGIALGDLLAGGAVAVGAAGTLAMLQQRFSSPDCPNTLASTQNPRGPFGNADPDIPIEKQLRGTGQLKDLRESPNLDGVDIAALLKKSPREIVEMQKKGEITKKTLKQLTKAFEGRDLGGRGGKKKK
jgi:RHS repeat-associated protein